MFDLYVFQIIIQTWVDENLEFRNSQTNNLDFVDFYLQSNSVLINELRYLKKDNMVHWTPTQILRESSMQHVTENKKFRGSTWDFKLLRDFTSMQHMVFDAIIYCSNNIYQLVLRVVLRGVDAVNSFL